MSYASLSSINVDQIFHEGKADLRKNYQKSLNKRYRTLSDIFVSDVALLEDISGSLSQFMNVAIKYLNKDESPFARVENALKALISTSFVKDKSDLFILTSDVGAYRDGYDLLYGRDVNVLSRAHGILKSDFEEIRQLISISRFERKVPRRLFETARRIGRTVQYTYQTTELFLYKLKNKDFAISLVPKNRRESAKAIDDLAIEGCYTELQKVKLHGLRVNSSLDILSQGNLLMDILRSVFILYGSDVQKLVAALETAINCTNDFLSSTKRIQSYVVETKRAMAKLCDKMLVTKELGDFHTELDAMRHSLMIISTQLHNYGAASLSKLDVFRLFYKNGENVVQSIKILKDNIKIKLAPLLTGGIRHTCAILSSTYMDTLNEVKQFYKFFNSSTFRHKVSQLMIFKGPVPNLENPGLLGDSGNELWIIWESSVHYEEFLKLHAKRELEASVDEYCRQLSQEVRQYQEALASDVNGLVAAMQLAEKTYKVTAHENDLNVDFIM